MKKFIISLITFIALVTLVGCSSGSETTSQELANVDNFTIGIGTTFPPFEFESADGEAQGIDVDLLKAIAEIQNFDYELETVTYQEGTEALNSGEISGFIGGLFITDQRKEEFDFSEPYYQSGIICTVKSDSTIETYDNLNGLNVGAVGVTASNTYAESIKDTYHFNLISYGTEDEMFEALNNGEISAFFDDYPSVGYAIKEGQDFKTIGDLEDVSAYGLMANKDNEKSQLLLEKFNQGLEDIKANGTYNEIMNKYLPNN